MLYVMWLDTRDDAQGMRYHVYFTESADRGETWGFIDLDGNYEPDVRVSDFPSNPNKAFPRGRFIGDYSAITPCGDDDVCLVWPDARLGEYGGINQKIAFSRKQAIRDAEIVVTPQRGSGGEEVTIQGGRFQPDSSVSCDVGGQVISFPGKTSLREGAFTLSARIPITASEGIVNIRCWDLTANIAVVTYFAEFGINDLASKQDLTMLTESGTDVWLLLLVALVSVPGTVVTVILIKTRRETETEKQ